MNSEEKKMDLKGNGCITKRGIVLSKNNVPYNSDLVFNAGVCKYRGKYIMIFRNDYDYIEGGRFAGTNLGLAYSADGVRWDVCPEPFFKTEDIVGNEITRIYDPRIIVLDGKLFLCYAVDTRHGIRGGIGLINDSMKLETISLSAPDNRNMVLFPEKINGMYVRLERPFPVYSRGGIDRFDMWISKSPDLKYWGDTSLLLAVEDVPYANDKVGPGAPPIKTDAGWLVLFHAVDIDKSRGKNGWEEKWQKRYCTGLMLLDLENPEKIIGIHKEPLIVPTEDYETKEGFRWNVVFPGGMLLEDDGEVKIYYGAADTVECLATARIDDLLGLIK
jgi:beta-1,4-mannooligosaccharide/beta-1,4-mannosyl-N-acetylglucosamine phosphorylase